MGITIKAHYMGIPIIQPTSIYMYLLKMSFLFFSPNGKSTTTGESVGNIKNFCFSNFKLKIFQHDKEQPAGRQIANKQGIFNDV